MKGLATSSAALLLLVAIGITEWPRSISTIHVRVANLTIGEKHFQLINSDKEDIYKVVYNSLVSEHNEKYSLSMVNQ